VRTQQTRKCVLQWMLYHVCEAVNSEKTIFIKHKGFRVGTNLSLESQVRGMIAMTPMISTFTQFFLII
jgi:hypothetical protein